MQYTVKNDTPFQILTSAIVIGPSQTGYVLEVAADGKNFSPLFTVGANVTRQVTNLSSGAYYRLSGNVGDVVVNWVRSCVTEGGSGGSGTTYSAGTYIDITQDVISVTGITPDLYLTSADTENFLTSADTQNFVTSAYVESAITEVEDHINDVEQVTASALTELHDGLMEVSGRTVDLSGYYTSAQTEEAISAATSGKADAATNVTPRNNSVLNRFWFPRWNAQGIIEGDGGGAAWKEVRNYFNGVQFNELNTNNVAKTWYAPVSAGTAGDILVSTGSGAPVWSAVTFPDVSNYVTSADVKTQIEAYNYMDSTDAQVISTALVDLNDRVAIISAATPTVDLSDYYTSAQTEDAITGKNYVTSAQVETQITDKNYVTSAQTDNAIADALTSYTPTTGFATVNGSAITNGGNLVIQGGGDMSAYWTSAQTESALTSVSGNLQTQINTIDTVVSDAMNDLNGRFNLLSASTVTSQEIRSIVKIEQTAYDTLVAQSATSQTTLYVVVPDAQ